MLAHQQRVVDERKELDEKLDKLRKFIKSNPLFAACSTNEQQLLGAQFTAMDQYSCILRRRIELFGINNAA